jgi:DNA-binding response OmpR family regulator
MPSANILLVDDDTLLLRGLALKLEQAGHIARLASSAEDALVLAHDYPPDLVMLDIGLPGMDGLEALQHFKESLNIPIIFVTARRGEIDQRLGLELGADDYVTKPFDADVLLARIKAVLRRSQHSLPTPAARAPLVVGDLTIDPEGHTVTVGERPIDLSPREFDILYAMALEAGHVLSTEDLLGRIWGAEYEGEPQVVYVHMRWLRDKIEEDPQHPRRILTVRGVGYKLVSRQV